jgi:hypothetical protein
MASEDHGHGLERPLFNAYSLQNQAPNSPTWARSRNLSVNSTALCQLSYRGMLAGGISMCGQNHLSHFQAVDQPGSGVALPAFEFQFSRCE